MSLVVRVGLFETWSMSVKPSQKLEEPKVETRYWSVAEFSTHSIDHVPLGPRAAQELLQLGQFMAFACSK